MIAIKDTITLVEEIDAELEITKRIDVVKNHQIGDKLLDSTFAPSMGSKEAICIHQSRSITC